MIAFFGHHARLDHLMEDTMQPTIHRRSNGTIDVGYYRTIAETMRREASIEMMRNARPTMWMMAACGAMLFAFAVLGRHHSVHQKVVHAASLAQADREP